ncbi:MAG: DUF116 domain-containing protein [Nitrospiraceae bacterium]|nr:DUF116 domain-containing protein [Nitrospiraceae bacterium]
MLYRFLRAVVLKVLYPVLMLAGGLSKGLKERFQAFTISLNNRLVLRERPAVKTLLLLLPHCLQTDECKIRITRNIYNCARCGKCGIKDIIGMADEFGIKLFVATGGNLARRIVKDVGPDAIVAVACERDLSSGISDSFPLPIFGVCNERPFGPCLNTKVDLVKLKQAILVFSGEKPGRGANS